MSKEYIGAIVLLLGAMLKMFGLEIENDILEGLIFGIITLVIAISRLAKGDINLLGVKR